MTTTIKPSGGSPSSWTNPNAITSSDDSYATYDVGFGESSGSLDAVGFGFAVPVGSTIVGIEIHFERSKDVASGSGVVGNTQVQMLKAGVGAGSQVNDAIDWPTSDAVATYGGASSLWGTAWTPADVNDANFGVQFIMDEAFVGSLGLRVDFVEIAITYTVPASVILSPGLYPMDWAGYAVGIPTTAAHGHGGFQGVSQRTAYFLYREQLARMRAREVNARMIQNAFNRKAAASYAKAQEQVRRNWAAAYTTLLVEV